MFFPFRRVKRPEALDKLSLFALEDHPSKERCDSAPRLFCRYKKRSMWSPLILALVVRAAVAAFDREMGVLHSEFPSTEAGRWERADDSRDWLTTNVSAAHLQCLERERQGDCYHENVMENGDSKSRAVMKLKYTLRNGDDALSGRNDWAWRGRGEPYLTYGGSRSDLMSELVDFTERRRFFIFGDSLSRQLAQSLRCTLDHKLGAKATGLVEYCPVTKSSHREVDSCMQRLYAAAGQDNVVVVNYGHHIDPAKSEALRNPESPGFWERQFKDATHLWLRAFEGCVNQKKCKPENVFFRTTVVRFFQRGNGDWDTNHTSKACGATGPNATAQWRDLGGLYPAQPRQNELLLDELKTSPFQVLDVAPVHLARADATFDCTHVCLPGPVDTWVAMLFHRIFNKKKQQQLQ